MPLFVFGQFESCDVDSTVKSIENIDYASFGDKKVQLDLYMPKKTGIYPGVILVHGGGWTSGTRLGFTQMAIDLAEKGYVVANIDYRLAAEAIFPGAVQDTKAAIRWLRANAKTYNINPNKIAGIGASAGGHLIAMAALTGHTNKFNGSSGNHDNVSGVLQATIIMGSGVNQVTRVKNAPDQYVKNCFIFFGGSFADKHEVYANASPINHISHNMTPILMLDGGQDKPGERYVDFRKKLDSHNVINEFKIIPDAKHGQWKKDRFRSAYTKAFDSFLKKHL